MDEGAPGIDEESSGRPQTDADPQSRPHLATSGQKVNRPHGVSVTGGNFVTPPENLLPRGRLLFLILF